MAENVLAGPEGPGEATRKERLTVAHRWEMGNGHATRRMFSFVPGFGVPIDAIGGGWVVPRLSTAGRERWAVDVLYTPSGARIVDWYVAVGRESCGKKQWCTSEEIGG